MSPLARSLLALAVLALLLHAACASPTKPGDVQCTTVSHGDTSNGQEHPSDTTIPAGVQQAYVDVQNPWCSVVRGQQVTVCDDVAPSLLLPDLPQYTPVYVSRNGQPGQPAYFHVSLWC